MKKIISFTNKTQLGEKQQRLRRKIKLLLKSANSRTMVTTVVENESFLRYCRRLETIGVAIFYVGVAENGELNLTELSTVVDEKTTVVCISSSVSETGNVIPIDRIAAIIKEKSSAALIVHISSIAEPKDFEYVLTLRNRLESEILDKIPNSRLIGSKDVEKRLPNVSNISFPDLSGESIVNRLLNKGVLVSTTSACGSKSHRPSHILQAMNVPFSVAMGSVNFVIGDETKNEDVDFLLKVLPAIIEDLRRIAGTPSQLG